MFSGGGDFTDGGGGGSSSSGMPGRGRGRDRDSGSQGGGEGAGAAGSSGGGGGDGFGDYDEEEVAALEAYMKTHPSKEEDKEALRKRAKELSASIGSGQVSPSTFAAGLCFQSTTTYIRDSALRLLFLINVLLPMVRTMVSF